MTDERRIVLPGDPGWDKLPSLDQEYNSTPDVPKLPNELLETAFQEVVTEVQEALAVKPEEVPAETPAAPAPPPNISYKFHRPAFTRRGKIPTVPIPKPITATLLEDLPKRWEKVCFVGGFDYVPVEGEKYNQRVRRKGFKTGDEITISGMVFFPGIGAMYEFSEGSRGSYCVRPDQVSFQMPGMDGSAEVGPVVQQALGQDVQSAQAEVSDAPVDGSISEVQQTRPSDDGQPQS